MSDKIKNAKSKVSNGLASASWLFALIGGFAATSTFIGTVINKVLIGPWWIPIVVGVIGFGYVLGDLLEDGVPDRLRTIYITILWPSTWLSIDGKIGKYLNGWIGDMNDFFDKYVKEWVTDDKMAKGTLMTGIAAIFITFSLLWAHRYYKINKAGSTPAASTTAPAVAARGRGRGAGNR